MLFNSPVFIFLFLPGTILLYFGLNQVGWRKASTVFLVAASWFFYAYWNPIYLPLLLTSIVVNFVVGSRLGGRCRVGNKRKRKVLLASGVIFNLLLLGFFKYADFAVGNLNWLLGTEVPEPGIILPLAISFFTFQQVAFLVDSYRLRVDDYGPVTYALFVSFFCQLVAGPIVHHKEMMPQFASAAKKRPNYDNVAAGLFMFAMGLGKKAVVADTFGLWANAGYGAESLLTCAEAWVTSLAYTMQLYFDFSGYTDMAIGAGLMFNIRIPQNFDSPYKATDLQDFWRRWHMTLSRFLRDYLYIPLGGNRKGEARTYVNFFLTFLLGGLWHGAAWTFVAWGAMHGAGTAFVRFWRERVGFRLPVVFGWAATFLFVHVAWVFFRAPGFAKAWEVLSAMFGGTGGVGFAAFDSIRGLDRLLGAAVMMPALAIVFCARNSNERLLTFVPSRRMVAIVSLLLVLDLLFVNSTLPKEFLYFDF